MLVLSRKVGEAIIIDDKIVIRIVNVSGSKIKLGIEAPSEVKILREEVADRAKK